MTHSIGYIRARDVAEDLAVCAADIKRLRLTRAECEADLTRVVRALGYNVMEQYCESLTHDFAASLAALRNVDQTLAAAERGLLDTILA